MRGKVYAKISKTGLGNCMLVWAHALVFAKINNLELITERWWRFRWGAIIRGEKKKRFYKNYFIETPLKTRMKMKFDLLVSPGDPDPEIKIIQNTENKIFIFTKTSRDDNLFKYLYPHSEFIKKELLELLTDPLKKKYSKCESPVIGIHIRRGDFKIINPITSNQFFIEAIHAIRETVKEVLPVTVFTDAEENEITDILELPGISISRNEEDILDILQMSKSKFLVLSRSSTFSYWAAFLSEGLVIMSEDDWQKQIKLQGEKYIEMRYGRHKEMDYKKILIRNAQ